MGERLTVLLSRLQGGDRDARDAVFAAAYQELRRLARARLRDGGRNTLLDTTALVHESYLRLVQAGELLIEDRRAFFGYASHVMRSVIVDSARARMAERRGGNLQKLMLSADFGLDLCRDEEGILRVHEAVGHLEKVDARVARMVEMRYFGGYSDAEIAELWASPVAPCSATGRRPRCCCARSSDQGEPFFWHEADDGSARPYEPAARGSGRPG